MTDPKQEWNSLYTESAGKIWRNEREELRNAAMLMHILSLEFSKIKNIIETEFSTYRNQLELKTRDEANVLNFFQNNTFNLTPVGITKPDNFKKQTVLGNTPLNTLSTNTSKQSYISPDLFQCESPDFSSAINPNEPSINELNESPKLNKHKRYYKQKKLKANGAELDSVKKIIVPESSKHVTPKRNIEDFIEDTPVVPSKKKLPKPGGVIKRCKPKAKLKFCNNTLTQMYQSSSSTLKEDENDIDATLCEKSIDATLCEKSIDATLCEKSAQKVAATKISDNIQVISDDGEITENENDLSYFAQNYDVVPNRNKIAEKEKVVKDNFCWKCDRLGVFCPKHIPESQRHRTCTGFWDIDFSVHDPNEDRDSQQSTIFL